MDPSRLRETLCAWAVEEGFDRAGIATLEPVARGGHFLRWLEAGHQAGMGYLERRVEARLEPARILDGARSVLCVALRYWPLAGEPEPAGDLWPRVARYARGRDYHDVVEKGLRALGRRIESFFPEARSRGYVDTGPVLERELAARAGLGTFGKNTCLLDREMGSWFLLGELFLTLEVAPSPPGPDDMCGSCRLCLDVCPTGALPEPFVLDANRCISYWTIEHRGELPEEVREGLGDWVFGCDLCQEVCPWNRRHLEPAHHPELQLPPERRELDLGGLLRLDAGEYRQRFSKSPMKRAKLEGLQRNAAVALGNRGEEGGRSVLAETVAEADPAVAEHAAWALARLDATEDRDPRSGRGSESL